MARHSPPPPERIVQQSGRPTTDPEICRRHGMTAHAEYGHGKRKRLRCKRCVADAVTRRHQKIKRTLVEEAGGRCAVCGYDRTVLNLHFHHVDPLTKSFGVSMCRGKSIAAFREEARKCLLVCASCHGEIEAGLLVSPPPQARYGQSWTPPPPEESDSELVPRVGEMGDALPLFDATEHS